MKKVICILILATLFRGGFAFADNNDKNKKNKNNPAPAAKKPALRPAVRSAVRTNAKPVQNRGVSNGVKNYNANPRSNSQHHPESVRHDAIRHDAVRHNEIRHDAVRRDEVRHEEARRDYVNPRLRDGGFHSAPRLIADRHQLMYTSRAQSEIHVPMRGPHGEIHAHVFERTAVNNITVRNHMAFVTANPGFRAHITAYYGNENEPNRYYWHTYGGFDYAHYRDSWGYHWYGWYLGGNYFWTRLYANNWWWYDPSMSRWCYWHDGGWWWQNPDNPSALYAYNNGEYISNDPPMTAPSVGENLPPQNNGVDINVNVNGSSQSQDNGNNGGNPPPMPGQ